MVVCGWHSSSSYRIRRRERYAECGRRVSRFGDVGVRGGVVGLPVGGGDGGGSVVGAHGSQPGVGSRDVEPEIETSLRGQRKAACVTPVRVAQQVDAVVAIRPLDLTEHRTPVEVEARIGLPRLLPVGFNRDIAVEHVVQRLGADDLGRPPESRPDRNPRPGRHAGPAEKRTPCPPR